MLPKHDIDSTSRWAFVAGCRNAFWFVGRVTQTDAQNGEIHLSRSEAGKESVETSVLTHVRDGDRFPSEYVSKGDTAKVVGHIYSGATADMDDKDAALAMRHTRMNLLRVDRPGLMDVRVEEADADWDGFDLPERFTRASNAFELAGFVLGRPFEADGRIIMFLAQGQSRENCIPIELSGKAASQYRDHLLEGRAIFVTGLIEPRDMGGGIVRPVARATGFRNAAPKNRDFTFNRAPEWVIDLQVKSGLRKRPAAATAGD